MLKNSYLKSAGQTWKLYLFFLIVPLVGLALVFAALNGAGRGDVNLFIFLVLSGLGLSISGLVLGVLTVKCPKCGALLLWKAVKEQPHQIWYSWLMGLDKCPICKSGYGD
jgi:phage FluMu protein Com